MTKKLFLSQRTLLRAVFQKSPKNNARMGIRQRAQSLQPTIPYLRLAA